MRHRHDAQGPTIYISDLLQLFFLPLSAYLEQDVDDCRPSWIYNFISSSVHAFIVLWLFGLSPLSPTTNTDHQLLTAGLELKWTKKHLATARGGGQTAQTPWTKFGPPFIFEKYLMLTEVGLLTVTDGVVRIMAAAKYIKRHATTLKVKVFHSYFTFFISSKNWRKKTSSLVLKRDTTRASGLCT